MATFRYIVADVFTDTPLEPPLRTRCSYLSTTNLDAAIEATKPPLNRHLQPTVVRGFAEEVTFEA
jgi:hypothetical protein